MELPAERRTDYDDLSDQIRKFSSDDEVARHAPYFAELDRLAAETPVTDDFDDHDASQFQADAEGATDIQEEIDGRLNDMRTIAAERAMAKWTKRKMEAEQVTEPEPEEANEQAAPKAAFTRSTPAPGTPEREKNDAAWKAYVADSERLGEARDKAYEEMKKAKYGSKKEQAAQKKYEKARETLDALEESTKQMQAEARIGFAEDLVENAPDEANRIAALAMLYDRQAQAKVPERVKGSEKAYDRIKELIRKEAKLQGANDAEAESLAMDISSFILSFPSQKPEDTVRRRVDYMLARHRRESAFREAENEVDSLTDLPDQTRRDLRRELGHNKDNPERVAEIIADARKSNKEAAESKTRLEAAAAEQESAFIKGRVERAVPVDSIAARINDAFAGRFFNSESDYFSDGRAIVNLTLLPGKGSGDLRRRSLGERAEASVERSSKLGKDMLDGAKLGQKLEMVGAVPEDARTEVKLAFFVEKDGTVHSTNAATVSWLMKNGGFDEARATTAGPSTEAILFLRDGKKVAITTEMEKGAAIDIEAMRKKLSATPKPPHSFRKKGDQAMAIQRPRLPGEVSARVKPLPPHLTDLAVSVHDIVETIKRDFDIPIRRGKLPAKALGIYRYLPEVIRVQGAHAGNLYVVTHELGHHLDKTTDVRDGVPDDARAELMANDYEPKQREDEGFAEFIRMYTTTENAPTYLPRFTEHFEKWLGNNPEVKTKVDRIRRLATKWRSMTPEGRALAQIWGQKRKPEALETSMLDTVAGAMNAAEHFYTKMMDKTYFVHKLAKASGAANAQDTASSAEYLSAYEMAAPSRAENALLNGPDTVTEQYRKLGPGIQGAFDKYIKSPQDYDSWKAWMLADHTLYMEEKNPAFRTGLDREDAKAILDGTDAATTERYEKLQKAFVDFNNNLLDVAVDAGVHSAAEAKRMKDYYGDHYLPLMRVRDDRMVSRLTRRFFNIKTPFRGRSKKGSSLPVMDFLEATILRTMSTYEASMRQHVLDKLIRETVPEYGGAESLGKFIEKIPPGMKPTEAELSEILDQIVETGIIDEEYAKTLKAVDALRNGRMESKLIPWLAGKYGVDLSAEDGIEQLKAKTDDIPSLESEIVIWRPVYRTSDTERIFRHVINGKPALFKIDNGLWDSFAGMAPLSMHPGLQTFGQVNRMFKMGATGIKPTFPLTNLIRDYQVFIAQEKNLKGTKRFTEPFKWSAIFAMAEMNRLIKTHTGKSIFADNEVAQLFDEMSGKIVNSLGVAPSQVSSMRKAVARKSGWASKTEAAKAAGYRTLQTVRDIVGIFESGPRLAAFHAYLATRGYELGADGKLTKDGQPARPTQSELVRAINEARDVTTNFVRSGSAGRFVDQFIPFFNAAIQSQDKEIRTLLEANKDIKSYLAGKAMTGAGKRVLTFLVGSAALQTLYWLMRHDDDDYEEMPWWLKYGYWTFGVDGKPIAKVPHAHTWNMVPAMTEAMLNSLEKKDANELVGAMSQQMGMRNPISGPAGVTPVVEAAFNYDSFRGRNIENQSLLKLPPEYRYRSDTSELAKGIGHITGKFGFGPLKVEHVLNQSTGGLAPSLRKAPWSGVLQQYEPMQSVDDFYDAKDKIEQRAMAEKVIHKRENQELNAQASDMNRYSAMLTEMRAAVRDEKDRDKRFETEKYMIGLARFALGKEPLDRYPNPLKTKNSPEHIAKIRREEIMRRAEKIAAYTPDSLTDLEKEAGVTLDEKKKAWEHEVEASRAWLKEIGADPAEVRILYKISLDSMKDKTIVARKLNYVEAMMKGAPLNRSWRPKRD